MNILELRQNRIRTITKLKAIKEEAYYGLTCREYNAIQSLINYIEVLNELDKIRIEGGRQ